MGPIPCEKQPTKSKASAGAQSVFESLSQESGLNAVAPGLGGEYRAPHSAILFTPRSKCCTVPRMERAAPRKALLVGMDVVFASLRQRDKPERIGHDAARNLAASS
jgi:hypothetical protein